jgi:hypothetical protein
MGVKEDIESVLKTLEQAVQTHLIEEQKRIDILRKKIFDATQELEVANAKDKDLIEEITYATEELGKYKPMDIFKELYQGGKRMKRSRSNRGRKSVRK